MVGAAVVLVVGVALLVSVLHAVPLLGSSEHSYLYQTTDEPFFPAGYAQQQYRAPSPSSSSLWYALDMTSAASSPEHSALGAASPPLMPAHTKSHLHPNITPLRIGGGIQLVLGGDSPLTPTSPEPFFTDSPNHAVEVPAYPAAAHRIVC